MNFEYLGRIQKHYSNIEYSSSDGTILLNYYDADLYGLSIVPKLAFVDNTVSGKSEPIEEYTIGCRELINTESVTKIDGYAFCAGMNPQGTNVFNNVALAEFSFPNCEEIGP